MREAHYTVEELTCPECGFVAKDRRGLNGHRQFKHGIHPSAKSPPRKLDLLVSESKLEQLLDARFAFFTDRLDALNSQERLDGVSATEQMIEKINAQIVEQLHDFDERLELVQIDQGLTEADKESLASLESEFANLKTGVNKLVQTINNNVEMVNTKFRVWGDKVSRLFQLIDSHSHYENGTLKIPELLDAEVALADKRVGDLPGDDIRPGKVGKKGWKYLEILNLSIKE